MIRVSGILLLVLLLAGCETTSEIPESKTNPRSVAQINTQLGLAYLREGRDEIALQKLEKALAIDPTYSDAYASMGLLQQHLGQNAEADRYFTKAITLEPKNSGALNNYGQFLCSTGNPQKAQEMFQRAIANPLYETPDSAFSNAGLCAKNNGQLEFAEENLREALKRRPTLASALYAMAEISFETKRTLAARGYLQRYHAVTEHTARSLWLGIQIERELGDRDAVASYSLALRGKFPDSEEARLLEQSRAANNE
jgi:type IV pilus assembly protein PilF